MSVRILPRYRLGIGFMSPTICAFSLGTKHSVLAEGSVGETLPKALQVYQSKSETAVSDK